MQRLLRILLLLLSLTALQASATTYKIRVTNQQEFGVLNTSIHKAAKGGYTKIKVDFKLGTYFFKEKHLTIGDIRNSKLTLTFNGNGAVIVPAGRDAMSTVTIPDYDYHASVIDLSNNGFVNVWSELQYADADVEVLNPTTKACRLKCSGLTSHKASESVYIMITAWCRSYYYKIERIEAPYIYFTADNLAAGIGWSSVRKGYNVNNDWICRGVKPRYRLCNLEPMNKGKVHVCEAQTFLTDVWGQLQRLDVNGFVFLGNKMIGDENSSASSLLVLNNVKAEEISVTNCRFIGQNSRVIAISKTANVRIENNYFGHNFQGGIVSYNSSTDTRIVGNEFEYNGEDQSASRCVTCSGTNYYVAENTFRNFGYCAISVGVPYASTKENESRGVVENNMLRYDDDWSTEGWKHNIMDGGAIYLWTQNDGAVIRYNRIDGYSGASDNRGIFCDDGAFGFEIYGNTVTNIPNSHCIDSRRFSSCEKVTGPTNINNKIYGNIVDGSIKFQGNEMDENGCELGKNYFLISEGEAMPKNVYGNVASDNAEETVETKGEHRGRIMVSREGYKKMKDVPGWRKVKKGFGKR